MRWRRLRPLVPEDASASWSPLLGLPRSFSRRTRWARGLFVGLVIGLVLAGLQARNSFSEAESHTIASRQHWRDELPAFQPPVSNITIVAIDDATCGPGWHGCPVPRADTARVIDRLHAAGARVIAVDQTLATPRDGTDALAQSIRRAGNVVLAQYLNHNGAFGFALADQVTLQAPLPVLAASAANLGLVDYLCGGHATFVTAYNLGCDTSEGWRPSIALAVYRLLKDQPHAYEGSGAMNLNYAGPPLTTYQTVSYRKVLTDPICFSHGFRVDCPGEVGNGMWDAMNGTVAIIGRTDDRSFGNTDLFDNPFYLPQPLPGVELQATALNTLLHHDAPILVEDFAAALLIVLLTLVMAALASGLAVLPGILFSGMMLALYYALTFFMQALNNVILPVVAPEIAMAVSFLLVLGARYSFEERDTRRTKQLLARFVAPQVADGLIGDVRTIAAGERRPIAVLFSDIRSFTTLSEYTEPETVMGALRTYFTRMVAIVQASGGMVDKFIGDGMMALFGAPAPLPYPSISALQAAIRMQAIMGEINGLLQEPLGTELRIGIGIHFGDAVFGLSGAPSKLEYTAVGDTVNTASRLESLCRDQGCGIVLSEPVFQALPASLQAFVADLGTVNVKGRQAALQVYGIRVVTPELLALLDLSMPQSH